MNSGLEVIPDKSGRDVSLIMADYILSLKYYAEVLGKSRGCGDFSDWTYNPGLAKMWRQQCVMSWSELVERGFPTNKLKRISELVERSALGEDELIDGVVVNANTGD